MPKLHQILAVKTDTHKMARAKLTEAFHDAQKTALLTGMTRTYQPLDEEGEQLPTETAIVQRNANDLIAAAVKALTALIDIEATIDQANTEAKADIVLPDNTVLARDVPATFLLWLEKELNDIVTFASKLPVLDASEEWHASPERGGYVTAPTITNRSKKVPTVLVKYAATDKHPAQTELVNEDRVVGQYTTTRMSGALPRETVEQIQARAATLRAAVKDARARANEQEAAPVTVAATMLDYVFG